MSYLKISTNRDKSTAERRNRTDSGSKLWGDAGEQQMKEVTH